MEMLQSRSMYAYKNVIHFFLLHAFLLHTMIYIDSGGKKYPVNLGHAWLSKNPAMDLLSVLFSCKLSWKVYLFGHLSWTCWASFVYHLSFKMVTILNNVSWLNAYGRYSHMKLERTIGWTRCSSYNTFDTWISGIFLVT